MNLNALRIAAICVVAGALMTTPLAVADSDSSESASSAPGSDGLVAEAHDAVVSLTRGSTSSVPTVSGSSGGSGDGASYAYGAVDPLCPSGKRSAVPVTIGGLGKELMVCLDAPVTQAPAGAPVVVTGADVARLIVDGSGAWRQPPGPQARTDKEVIVYTSPDPRTLTTTVAGTTVTVVATPVSYQWDWGDSTTTTTTDPGAPYPDQTVYHHYTATRTNVTITVTTTWDATFTPDGGTTQPVAGTVTTTSTTTPFDLVRAVVTLTDDAEEAQGH